MLELLAAVLNPAQAERWPVWKGGNATGAGPKLEAEVPGYPKVLLRGILHGLYDIRWLFSTQAHYTLRFVLSIALFVAICVMLMRPRGRAELADLMLWRERSELGAVGAHLDRWPEWTRQGLEGEPQRGLWECLPPRNARSDGDVRIASASCRTRAQRVRVSRTI